MEDNIMFDLTKGKKIDEYIMEILSVEDNFCLDMGNIYIYSQETIDKLAQYYFKKFISANSAIRFPKINRNKLVSSYYYCFDEVPFDRQIGAVFIKSGNLLRDYMMENGISCSKYNYEILPTLLEMSVYEDLSRRLDDDEIKVQGLSYHLNKVRSAAIDLYELSKIPIEYQQNYQIKKRADFDKMIITSQAFASVIYNLQTNENISKRIKRIVTSKEKLDRFLTEERIDYNDPRIEKQLSYQLNYLQFPTENFGR